MSGCPKCNESHIEKEIRVLIEEYNIEYIYNGRQTQHPWLEGLELDFYIPDIKLAIECQGEQHFMPVAFSGNNVPDEEKQMDFNNILERDERKRVLCKEHNVELIYYSDLDIEYPYEVFTDKNKVMDYIKTKFKEQNKPLHLKNESEESSLKNELTQESEEPSLKILKKIDNNHSNCSCVDCQTSQTPQPIKYRSLY